MNNISTVRDVARQTLEHYRLADEYPLPDLLSTDNEFVELALAVHRAGLAERSSEMDSNKRYLAGRAERQLLDAARERAREILLESGELDAETLERLGGEL